MGEVTLTSLVFISDIFQRIATMLSDTYSRSDPYLIFKIIEWECMVIIHADTS